MKKLLTVMLVIGTLFACKKEAPLLMNKSSSLNLRESKSVANPENAYDMIGQIHNRAMDVITLDSDLIQASELNSINFNDVNFKVDKYLQESEQCVLPDRLFSPELSELYQTILTSNNLPKLLKDYGWSRVGVRYSTQLFNILDSSEDQKLLYEGIVKLEHEIIIDRTLPDTERDILLSTASISRYSIDWWTNTYNGQLEKPNGWKADAAGALAGGIAGAIVGGTVTVGLATVPGWVAGAIGGGISNSIMACFDYYM